MTKTVARLSWREKRLISRIRKKLLKNGVANGSPGTEPGAQKETSWIISGSDVTRKVGGVMVNEKKIYDDTKKSI